MLQSILLQADGQGGNYSSLILLAGIAIVFYFFMIRPQQKKQKEQKKFLEEIKRGDHVVTIGGIHGKVLSVEEDKVVMEVDKGVKLIMSKSSISLEASQSTDKEDSKS